MTVNHDVAGSSPAGGAIITPRCGTNTETPCKSRGFSVFCASFEIHTSRQTIIDFLSKPGLEPGKRLEVKIFEDKSAVFSY